MKPKYLDETCRALAELHTGRDGKISHFWQWVDCGQIAGKLRMSRGGALHRMNVLESWGLVERREYRRGWFGYYEFKLTDYAYEKYKPTPVPVIRG